MICVSPWNRCSHSPEEETKHQHPEIIINNIIIQHIEILPTHGIRGSSNYSLVTLAKNLQNYQKCCLQGQHYLSLQP